MTDDSQEPTTRRPLGWPDVSALAIVAVLLIAGGLMVLACLGRWPS